LLPPVETTHPYYSGPDGVTVDKLDGFVNTVGAAGAVVRGDVYQITNQSRPFSWVAGSKWADLLVDAGTVASDSGTGQKVLTLGAPLVIPPHTWFAVGGVDQVATPATRNVGGLSGQNFFTRFGNTTGSYSLSSGVGLLMNAVTGALPAAFTPSGVSNIDSGVGMHRSA
jgi:hypothetical protein